MIEQYPSFGPEHIALFKMQRIQQAQVLEGGYEVVELIGFELDYSLSPNFLIYFLPSLPPSLPIPSLPTLHFFPHSQFIKPLLICLMWQMRGGSWWTGNGKRP